MIKNARDCIGRFTENLKIGGFISDKIKFEYENFGFCHNSAFYLLNDKCLMAKGENLSVGGDLSPEEIESVKIFCRFTGLKTIESRQGQLPLPVSESLTVMEAFSAVTGVKAVAQVCKNKNIYDFAGFCSENFPGIDRDFVYPYFILPINRGTGNLYTINENNKILSGAFVADYCGYGYISFVSTAARARGNGCAGTIIKTILADLQNKPARLVCRNELVNFYKNLGFKKTDKLYLYNISE